MRPHGTRRRYVRDECRCVLCTAANAAYQRERKRAMTRPDSVWLGGHVPAGPARSHLEQLLAGAGIRETARRVNLSPGTLAEIRDGASRRITRRTRDAILALNPGHNVVTPARPAGTDTNDIDHLYHELAQILDDRHAPWRRHAACRHPAIPIDIFFPGRGEPTTPAHDICSRCAARPDCLAYAQAHYLDHGIWGGHAHKERRDLRRETEVA